MNTTGAHLIWQCLLAEGVDRVFGYPGGAILPTYDALTEFPQIHHVLCRHEQGATHMADGYARASGKVGVVIATSGPGATNLVTGLATAHMDSSPVVCITGQVPRSVLGSDAFQETDTRGIALPVTKHAYCVENVDELPFVLHEAFTVARSGRPGAVLVDVPKDVQLARPSRVYVPEPIRLPGNPLASPAESLLDEAWALIEAAERPVILAGHGILLARAERQLRELAERLDLPVALTLLGKGGFPEGHPLCLGMMGMHGHAATNRAIQQADLLIALGMRFDDRVTGKLATYAPLAKKIHIDIDPAEIGKNVLPAVGIVADLAPAIAGLLRRAGKRQLPAWWKELRAWQTEGAERDILARPPQAGDFPAARAIDALYRATGGDVVTVTDVGQHQMWEAQYFPHQRPGTLFTSGGMGTMGFALPAAIGVKMAKPEEEVWVIVGDGGFQMTQAELATAVQEGIEVKIAIVNNGYLGMVRQWQELFYDQRYQSTPILSPDFCRLAEAYGIPSRRVAHLEQVPQAVEHLRRHRGGPVLLELVVDQHDVVYPMVPAGADLDAMIRRPAAGTLDAAEA